MDPNETLRRIQEITARFNERATYEDMDELVEHVQTLDGWLSKGGYLPDDWDHTPRNSGTFCAHNLELLENAYWRAERRKVDLAWERAD